MFQFEEFKDFYINLTQRGEINSIFNTYSNSDPNAPKKNVITVKQFLGESGLKKIKHDRRDGTKKLI